MAGATVGDVGEFGLIARVTARLGPVARGLPVGPGDDAAVVPAPDGRVVATTDLLVDGRHFRTDWSTGYDVGRKAAAQNLADVAAMGARPTALLVGLGVPASTTVAWCEALVDGLRDEAAVVGAAVAGGDVVRSDVLTVAVTALGDLEGRTPLLRSGARPGQVVLVVGRLGWAAAGLAVLERGDAALVARHAAVVDAHRRPRPPYVAAGLVADAGATSLVDVSDGLAADLGHVAAASEVRIELSAADLPLAEEVVAAATDLGVDPRGFVAGGGDDHALVATLPADGSAQVMALLQTGGHVPAVAEVGRVVAAGPGGPAVTWLDGAPPGAGGHDHFSAAGEGRPSD